MFSIFVCNGKKMKEGYMMGRLITEEEFLEGCLKLAPPNSKLFKFEKDGRTYYHIGEPNLNLLAKLLVKHIK